MKKLESFLNETIIAFASIRAGFIFALMGTVAQTTHTWFIALQFSSFTGSLALVQAAFVSFFLSGGLLFYIVRAGSAETVKDKMKYNRTANAFMSFEIFINLFYWLQKIVFVPWFVNDSFEDILWYELIIAVPFSILIPVILKSYGGEIDITAIKRKKKAEVDKAEVEDLQKELHDFITSPQTMKIISVDSENRQYKVEFKKK